jgi:TRAP transporter TAXI family solute receptor
MLCCSLGFLGVGPGAAPSFAQTAGASGGTPLLLAPTGSSGRHASRHRWSRKSTRAAKSKAATPEVTESRSVAAPHRAARGRHHYVSRAERRRAARAAAKPAVDEAPTADEEAADDQSGPSSVSILTGGLGTTSSRIAADLAAVLDSNSLRVLPVLGKGSTQNLSDLTSMPNMDLALVQSDALGAARPKGQDRIAYLARLYNEEVQIVAGPDIKDLRQLAGRKVAVDLDGSGTATTAGAIFSRLGIKISAVYLDPPAALEKLRTGELAAVVIVSGKPAPALAELKADSGLHLLPVPYAAALQDVYYPARVTSTDYPDLVKAGANVDTVAVGTILAVYNAAPGTARYRRLAEFSRAFFRNFDALRSPPRHPKWREVNLAAEVNGWTRFAPARDALDRMPASASKTDDAPKSATQTGSGATSPSPAENAGAARTSLDGTSAFDKFVASRTGGTSDATLSTADQDRLLKEFQKWNRTRSR